MRNFELQLSGLLLAGTELDPKKEILKSLKEHFGPRDFKRKVAVTAPTGAAAGKIFLPKEKID